MSINSLEKSIGYSFKNKELLLTALTHSSYANENRIPRTGHNERLEFLGDSVLGMIVAHHLYCEYPELPEGEMTRIRAELVCEHSLYHVAKRLGLGAYLRLGKGEDSGGGRERPSILADAVEAIIAAIFLDGGKDEATAFVRRFILSPLEAGEKRASSDYKTTLQEIVQRKIGNQLSYRIVGESGPDHAKSFVAEVLLNGKRIGLGSGRSKKEAEQAAAKDALENNEL